MEDLDVVYEVSGAKLRRERFCGDYHLCAQNDVAARNVLEAAVDWTMQSIVFGALNRDLLPVVQDLAANHAYSLHVEDCTTMRLLDTNHDIGSDVDVDVLDASLILGSIQSEDVDLVNSRWPYRASWSCAYIQHCVSKRPTFAFRRRDDGVLVAWVWTHNDSSIGGLWVESEYRGRGLATRLVQVMTRKLLSCGVQPFGYVVETNTASLRVFTALGYVPCERICWCKLSRS